MLHEIYLVLRFIRYQQSAILFWLLSMRSRKAHAQHENMVAIQSNQGSVSISLLCCLQAFYYLRKCFRQHQFQSRCHGFVEATCLWYKVCWESGMTISEATVVQNEDFSTESRCASTERDDQRFVTIVQSRSVCSGTTACRWVSVCFYDQLASDIDLLHVVPRESKG